MPNPLSQMRILSLTLFMGLVATGAAAQQAATDAEAEDLYQRLWELSGHADAASPSFNRWNADGAVPATCAGCHTTTGFLDWTGADGSAAGSVEHPVPIGETVACAACHAIDPQAVALTTFPSGATFDHGSASGTCLACHQGRTSGETVANATATIDGDDTVSAELRFVNIHFGPAAVMQGTDGRGGFEYPGQTYAGRFAHVEGFDTCTAWHDPHSTQVVAETCVACHGDVALRDIRLGSPDIDGDGDMAEGVAAEIHALHEALGAAIADYAGSNGGPIAYAKGFPYFFNDLNGNSQVDEDERRRDNGYVGFTPRLLRAAYNYQVVATDPGAWAHNPRYAAQLLHDSIADLAAGGSSVTPPGERP